MRVTVMSQDYCGHCKQTVVVEREVHDGEIVITETPVESDTPMGEIIQFDSNWPTHAHPSGTV